MQDARERARRDDRAINQTRAPGAKDWHTGTPAVSVQGVVEA